MISVAMTTYNGEKFIREQLESIEGQELSVDEVVILDDASSDSTVELIQKFMKETSLNIRLYINKENRGYIKNFRKAIEKTKGEYIFLCDQDDIWYKDKTKVMISIMKKNNVGVLFTQYDIIDGKGIRLDNNEYRINGEKKYGDNLIQKITLERMVYGNIAPGCTYAFTKDIKELYLRAVDTELIHDYSIALIGACLGKSFYLNKKTIAYRIHSSNSIGIKKKDSKINIKFHLRKKPLLISFLDNYKDIIGKWTKIKISFILYLRLPIIRSYAKTIYQKILVGRKNGR